jgi:tRNA pseudouridine13 synthase
VPEDFRVEEELGFAPEGAGQHAWLRVRKRGANTAWVAQQLARAAGVRRRDVGWSGLKDRDAVTTQWLSVDLAGRPPPDWAALGIPGVEVLGATWHRRKLRPGSHRGNRFAIRLRELTGEVPEIAARLEALAAGGVPNYFGPQRFGRAHANLEAARGMLLEGRRPGRAERSILLSAARALLFNRVLAARVAGGSWRAGLPGDLLMLAGSASVFPAPELDAALRERLAGGDLHPAAPLWGRGALPVTGAAREALDAALAPCSAWCAGLEAAGLELAWRACRLPVADAALHEVEPGAVEVRFRLPRGGYATAVLRELLDAPGL